ncbi:glycosyltransferase [Chryseobacterium gotjawalense]|uniref:Glycosyltransferase n=1 Tax=Chryseobacterium gotjawalense TaxID=3042315 RepID=A0ABY8RI69_9FLAO|nr:glycosyltransferase family 2 protein [Chryseobacterium sp. wdc7]WHF53048.1 glycosyltransferase [Chryseobacterium sp. wdc7]
MAPEKPIKLSIIIPTIGRKKELQLLLNSIVKASLPFSFEVVIIDQNPAGFLEELVLSFAGVLPVQHHVVDFKGLSKAKNYGVLHSSGQYVSFPDDDCIVFKNTYPAAFAVLEKTAAALVFGKCIDDHGKDSVLNFQKKPSFLSPKTMAGGFVEATVIADREVLLHFTFDENMGAGTFFGAEEGFDWLYRILTESDYTAYYTPEIHFYHPQVILSKGDLASLNRVFQYRCGTAYLCVKHGLHYKFYKRLIMAQMACYIYFFTNRSNADYYKIEVLALKIGKICSKKKLF